MSTLSQPTAEYPPRVWENNDEFMPPGPVSQVLVDYLAMCAPRSAWHLTPGSPSMKARSDPGAAVVAGN